MASWAWAADRIGPVAGWWRSQGPVARDSGLAVVLAAAAFGPALSSVGARFGDLPRRPADLLYVLLVLGQTLPLAARTRWPAACLAVIGVSFAVNESLGYPPTFGSLGLYAALYSAGAWQARSRRALAGAATGGYVAFAVAVHELGSPERLADYIVFYLALAAFWVAGALVRRYRATEAERRELKAREATAAERSRIARELHDVVTHHVTAMVVQADAGQFLAGSPDRVAETMSAISETGRRALTDLRYQLGLLEATGEPEPESTGRGPASVSASAGRGPVLGSLRDLAEQARLGGQPVELTESGDRPPLSVGLELAVYRVVQESLTNAVRHAAGRRTAVAVRYSPGQVEIDVTTAGEAEPAGSPQAPDGRPRTARPVSASPAPVLASPEIEPPGGRGLRGLRERVSLLDGELVAAGEPGGGFRVSARLPVRSGS